jgi:hypothetical protein
MNAAPFLSDEWFRQMKKALRGQHGDAAPYNLGIVIGVTVTNPPSGTHQMSHMTVQAGRLSWAPGAADEVDIFIESDYDSLRQSWLSDNANDAVSAYSSGKIAVRGRWQAWNDLGKLGNGFFSSNPSFMKSLQSLTI